MSANGFIDSGVKCGNCKQYHSSAAAVKLCFAEAKAEVQAQAQPNPATEKQVGFLLKLAGERPAWADVNNVHADTIKAFASAADGKASASYWIGEALKQEKEAAAPQFNMAQELDDGVYRKDGTFYKVYHTVHGANVQVAKVLLVTPKGQDADGNELFGGTWEYVGKKPLYTLRPEHKLTQDEAKQFGLVYGMCVRCARDLTREESIHVGYGATCAGHEGWWYPTKTELKALLLVDPKGSTVEPAATEPAWKAQVAQAEQDSLAEYMAEPAGGVGERLGMQREAARH